MFRIHRVYDDTTPTNQDLLRQVQKILRENFATVAEAEVMAITSQVRDPLFHRFKTTLFVAEQGGVVQGCAVLLHMSDLDCCFLDFISTGTGKSGGGVGGAHHSLSVDDQYPVGKGLNDQFIDQFLHPCGELIALGPQFNIGLSRGDLIGQE